MEKEKIERGLWYISKNKIVLLDKDFNLYKEIEVKDGQKTKKKNKNNIKN